MTKLPLSLHRMRVSAGQHGLLDGLQGWTLQCHRGPRGCCLAFEQQNDCSLGSPPAREKGWLCCASWSNWSLHKSKTMGHMLTV